MNARVVAVIVGLAVVGAALAVRWTPTSRAAPGGHPAPDVSAVVRNDLGQLRWVSVPAADYTPLEAEGRRVYLRAGCSFCHSQYRRPITTDARPWGPVSADPRRWGPPSEAGEYAHDVPPAFGPGGIGPDLSREGLKYSDEWHLAHFWNPPMITRDSVMGGISGLFDAAPDPIAIVAGAAGEMTLAQTADTRRLFDFSSRQKVKLTPNDQGLLFVPMEARGQYPLIWLPNKEYGGQSVKLVAETPDLQALIAYIQKLGTSRGRWREMFEPDEVEGTHIALPRSAEWIARGKQVYERRCIACHGVRGDGNGWAATFLYRQRPRNFTFGEFKFRLTKGRCRPTRICCGPSPAACAERRCRRGSNCRSTTGWRSSSTSNTNWRWTGPIHRTRIILRRRAAGRAVADRRAAATLGGPGGARAGGVAGRQMLGVSRQLRPWRRREGGRVEGRLGLSDPTGQPDPRPVQVEPQGGRPLPDHLDRTERHADAVVPRRFPDTERWALAYYILSLSAFTDTLTASTLALGAADRTALDSAVTGAGTPEQAYVPRAGE